jgi:ribonuclease VapC
VSVVLDASALLAMLQGEKGAAKVAAVIAGARVCAINYSEVVGHFVRLGMPVSNIDAMLDPLPIEIVPADKELGKTAGELRAVTMENGLSLGDRYCLALARRDGLSAWSADKAWKTIADAAQVKVVLIR